MIKSFFIDFSLSALFSIVLFFLLTKMLMLNTESAFIIAMISFSVIFLFSLTLSFYLYKIKQKMDLLNTQIEKLNKFDEITDVYNRNFLLENLQKYFDISKRKEIPLSIMIIDIDNFKRINEKYGFEKGNEVLKKVSYILKNNLRGMDIVGRYSSDEFLIASFSTKDEFLKLAIRIHELLKNINDEINIEVSIGVTERNSFDSLKDMLRKAQEAVYLAQKKGGNRVDFLEHFLLIE